MTTAAPVTTIRLYDEIGGDWGIPAADLVAELDAAPGDVELRISSPAATVFQGLTVYSALRQQTT